MNTREKLLQEFDAAIIAILGTDAETEYENGRVGYGDLIAIAKKVAFYLDLD